MQLQNHVSIITGGSRGIGRAVSVGFVREGAQVVVVGRDAAVANDVVAEITQEFGPDRAIAVAADVAVAADNQRMVEATLARFGRIDSLIACHGIITPAKFMDISEAQWDQNLDINLKGTFLAMQAVLPHMIERNSGKIVTNTSLAGLKSAGWVDYSVSKAGIIALTQKVARELRQGGYRINVNSVSPAAETRMTEALAGFRGLSMEQYRSTRTGILMSPEDTVPLYVFLASAAANFITGQVIAIDDGHSV